MIDESCQYSTDLNGHLFDLADDPFWISGYKSLIEAIDQKIEVIEHDCADQCGITAWFQGRGTDRRATKELHVDSLDKIAFRDLAIGILDFDSLKRLESQ